MGKKSSGMDLGIPKVLVEYLQVYERFGIGKIPCFEGKVPRKSLLAESRE